MSIFMMLFDRVISIPEIMGLTNNDSFDRFEDSVLRVLR